jgi:hypothetical protein
MYWKAGIPNLPPGAVADAVDQLTKDDPDKNELLNISALALAGYGLLVLVFWWANVFLRIPAFFLTGHDSLSYNIYSVLHPVIKAGLA